MAQIPFEIKDKVQKFLKILEMNNVKIDKAVIYGSYAKGNYNEWSDIDLALVSSDFTGNSFEDRVNLIDYIYESGLDISPVTYRPEDFEDSLFVRDEIMKNGQVIMNEKSVQSQ